MHNSAAPMAEQNSTDSEARGRIGEIAGVFTPGIPYGSRDMYIRLSTVACQSDSIFFVDSDGKERDGD
jgi:hypothetical protein